MSNGVARVGDRQYGVPAMGDVYEDSARGEQSGRKQSVWCAPHGGRVRRLFTRLQPLLTRREELKVHLGS